MSEPRPSISFDRVADEYDRTRGGERRGEQYAEAIAPLLDAEGRILEVGIGTGLVAAALARRGFEVLGVDLSPAMAARARERLGGRVVVGDARRLPFRDESMAAACSVWVLHVVGEVPGALAEVGRVLAPGGTYVVAPGDQPSDDIGRRIHELARALDPERRRDDSVERLTALAPAAGLSPAGTVPYTWEFDESPADVARKVEGRTCSFLWNLDQARWDELVQPVITWLRARPNADRPERRRISGQLVVLRR